MMILTKEPSGDNSRYIIMEIIGDIAVYDRLSVVTMKVAMTSYKTPNILIRNNLCFSST